MDLDNVDIETFARVVGTDFTIAVDDTQTLHLKLAEASPYGDAEEAANRDGLRTPFAIVFEGPPEPVLAQQTLTLQHAELGSLVIFLVPIGPSEGAMRYEAVFA